jgi:hypothetical protein
MVSAAKRQRSQFSLRSLLAGITWTALVVAICVSQQQAATRQRQVIEQLKAAGILPPTLVGGRPLPPAPAPPAAAGPAAR